VSALTAEEHEWLEELAPLFTVRQLAEKLEVTTTTINNALRRIGIKAKPAGDNAKAAALRHKSLKGQHVSPRIAKILELSEQKHGINSIAKQLGITPNYVSRIREVYGMTDKDEYTRQMLAKVDEAQERAKQTGDPIFVAALCLHGWTKGKYNYWRRKKAANKSG